MKLGGGISKAVDAVGDAFEEETVFTAYGRIRSRDLCNQTTKCKPDHPKNTRALESVSVRIPKAEERRFYILYIRTSRLNMAGVVTHQRLEVWF